MKIVIAATTDIYFDQRVRKIADALVHCGHEVTVVGRKISTEPGPGFNFELVLLNCLNNKGVFFYLEYAIRLFLFLLKKPADLVCACDLDTVLAVGSGAAIKQRPWCFDAHEYFEHSIELQNAGIKTWIWSRLGCFFIPKAQFCYTVSQTLCNELSKKYSRTFELIRNVSRRNSNAHFNSSGRSRILWYQGAINQGRGLELMIQCLVKLPDYRIQLAGTGDIVNELKKLAADLKVDDRVEFLGRITMDKMLNYAASARIGFDLLDAESKSYYYSLSNKTFDYIHTALPVIQMNFPEYAALHKEFQIGILMSELNENELLQAVRTLEDEVFYQTCLDHCKAAAQAYHWELEAKKLCRIYGNTAP